MSEEKMYVISKSRLMAHRRNTNKTRKKDIRWVMSTNCVPPVTGFVRFIRVRDFISAVDLATWIKPAIMMILVHGC